MIHEIKEKLAAQNISVFAITGGIASGKSTACEFLKKQANCLAFFDLDQINQELLQQQEVLLDIRLHFMKQENITDIILNDIFQIQPHDDNDDNDVKKIILNKAALRAYIFQYPELKKILEQILHPLIFKTTLEKIEQSIQSIPPIQIIQAVDSKALNVKNHDFINFIVIGIPLLKQNSPWLMLFDHILQITAPLQMRLNHLKARGIDLDLAKNIIQQQNQQCDYESLATYRIDNSNDIMVLEAKLAAWLNNIYTKK